MKPAAIITMIIASVLMLLVIASCGALIYGCAHAIQVGCQRQPGSITCQH